MTKRQSFLFVDLAEQIDGTKPFDGMAAGEFTDMYGRRAAFKKEDLPTYVKNTKAVLASTKDSNGVIVGLPIDTMNHDHREAAGWVVDVELGESGDVVLFSPRWNPVGVDMIGNDIARFFSPTIDLSNKTIEGGSLTNWPATRDEKTGKILLRPIELSAQMFELSDESLPDRIQRIARAFREMFRDGFDTEYAWPVDVFEGYVICELNDKLYKVEFKETADGLEFSEFEKWTEVKRSYVEAAMREFKKWISGLFKPGQDGEPTGEPDLSLGAAKMPDPITSPVAPVQLTAEQAAQMNALVTERVNLGIQGWMEQEQRKNRILDFTRTVTGKGLPVQGDDLTAFLSTLTNDQLEKAEALFGKIAETGGTLDFSEHGHSKTVTGAQQLPPMIKASLSTWLASGQTVEEFFKVNAVELGAMADYNLSEFTTKDAK